MNKILFRIGLLMLIAFAVSGSACTQQIVVQDRIVLVTPDDNLMVDCDVETPPEKEDYLASATTDDEEQKKLLKQKKALVDYGNAQTKNVIVCNKRWDQLRQWKVKQKDIYKTDASNPKGDK